MTSDGRAEFVYLIAGGNGSYKIGYSMDPHRRLQDLQVASPVPLSIAHSIETDFARHLESALHTRFAGQRCVGEWFTLTPDDVAFVMGLDGEGVADLAGGLAATPHGPDSLAGVIFAAIRKSGMSALQLSRETGVPQPRISDFLSGKDIRMKTAGKLARRLGLELRKKD